MSVKKRNGVWYTRFWVHQKEFYFTVPEARTKRMAERFERFYRDRVSALLTRYTLDDITIDMIRHSDEHGSLSVTMRELADAYIASRRGKRTFHDLHIKANKLVDYFGPNKLIRTIGPFETNSVRIWQTKTEREKTIPLSSRLRVILSELRARAESDRVFPSPRDKDKHLENGDRYTSVKTAWNKACKRAGISGLRFHDLRATFITRLIENGVDIGTVKSLSGHTTLAALQRYMRISEDAKQRAIEKLSELAA